MKICLKNIKYLYYNYQTKNFDYYVGNCYVENGVIIGFGNEENGFDSILDMTNKLLLPICHRL